MVVFGLPIKIDKFHLENDLMQLILAPGRNIDNLKCEKCAPGSLDRIIDKVKRLTSGRFAGTFEGLFDLCTVLKLLPAELMDDAGRSSAPEVLEVKLLTQFGTHGEPHTVNVVPLFCKMGVENQNKSSLALQNKHKS